MADIRGQKQIPNEIYASSDRREFLKIAGSAATGIMLPPNGYAGTGIQSHLSQSPSSGSPSFNAGDNSFSARMTTVGDMQIQYFEGGNEAGTPVVLVHGFPDSPLAWQGVLKHLEISELRIVMPYLRGYGRTVVAKPDEVTGEFAALGHDLLGLADALKLERFHIVGHDWGARTSYAAAVLAPERVLTLTALASPYLGWKGGLLPPAQVHGYWYQLYFQVDAARTMLTEYRQDFCRELWKTWCPTWQFTEKEFQAAAAAWNNPQFVEIVLSYYRMRWGGAVGKPAYAGLQAKLTAKPEPKIAVPTVFIQGNADACDLIQGADGQESCFTRGYERIVLPNVGHFPHRENPSAVAQSISKSVHAV